MKIPRFHRHEDDAPHTRAEVAQSHVVQISVDELADVFSAPRWLRDLGFASWLLVGLAALLFGMVGLVLAAPLMSAAVRISAHLARAKAAAAATAPGAAAEPEGAPG